MKILFLFEYGRSLETWSHRHSSGDVAERTPYGLGDAADRLGHAYAYGIDHPEGRVRKFGRKALARIIGTDLVHVWRNVRDMAGDIDLVITHTEMTSIAYALIRRLRTGSPPALSQVVWFPEEASGVRGLVGRWALARADVVSTESPANAAALARVLNRQVLPVHFGIERRKRVHSARSSHGRPVCVVVGNDRHRDWQLALDVARELPNVDFEFASRVGLAKLSTSTPSNVSILKSLGSGEVDLLLAGASLMLLPLLPNAHASGITTILEASDQECPVLVTRAGGLEYYLGTDYEGFVDGGAAEVAARVRGVIDSSAGVDLTRSLVRRCARWTADQNLQERIDVAASVSAVRRESL